MNKMVKIGSLCLIVVLGLVFVGCDDFQKVEFASIGKPGNVQAVLAKDSVDGDTILLTWDAVSGDNWYKIVFSQDKKKAAVELQLDPDQGPWLVYNDDTGVIPDVDKWKAEILLGDIPASKGQTFIVGVIAQSKRNDKNDSSPAWASGTFTKGDTKFTN